MAAVYVPLAIEECPDRGQIPAAHQAIDLWETALFE
jgi:hypothetical protein